MRALALVAALTTVSLSACNTLGTATSPAPLNSTVIDDRAVRYAFLTLDTLATLADQAIDAKIIVPGSDKARAIAKGLTEAKQWINAASAAQKAGSVASYNEAFQRASEALALVRQALGKSTSLNTPARHVPVDVVVARLA